MPSKRSSARAWARRCSTSAEGVARRSRGLRLRITNARARELRASARLPSPPCSQRRRWHGYTRSLEQRQEAQALLLFQRRLHTGRECVQRAEPAAALVHSVHSSRSRRSSRALGGHTLHGARSGQGRKQSSSASTPRAQSRVEHAALARAGAGARRLTSSTRRRGSPRSARQLLQRRQHRRRAGRRPGRRARGAGPRPAGRRGDRDRRHAGPRGTQMAATGHGVVVLLTDSVDDRGADPVEASERSDGRGARGYGQHRHRRQRRVVPGTAGSPISTRWLRSIAANANGAYAQGGDASTQADIPQHRAGDEGEKKRVDGTNPFALSGGLLLLRHAARRVPTRTVSVAPATNEPSCTPRASHRRAASSSTPRRSAASRRTRRAPRRAGPAPPASWKARSIFGPTSTPSPSRSSSKEGISLEDTRMRLIGRQELALARVNVVLPDRGQRLRHAASRQRLGTTSPSALRATKMTDILVEKTFQDFAEWFIVDVPGFQGAERFASRRRPSGSSHSDLAGEGFFLALEGRPGSARRDGSTCSASAEFSVTDRHRSRTCSATAALSYRSKRTSSSPGGAGRPARQLRASALLRQVQRRTRSVLVNQFFAPRPHSGTTSVSSTRAAPLFRHGPRSWRRLRRAVRFFTNYES